MPTLYIVASIASILHALTTPRIRWEAAKASQALWLTALFIGTFTLLNVVLLPAYLLGPMRRLKAARPSDRNAEAEGAAGC